MEILDTAFAQMVKEHKSTIYTVCFMFSKDSDEVSDLFQEVLINLWKGYDSFKNLSNISHCIYNRLLLNILYVINQKYGLNL